MNPEKVKTLFDISEADSSCEESESSSQSISMSSMKSSSLAAIEMVSEVLRDDAESGRDEGFSPDVATEL